jgi:hypothetical protein
MVFLQKGIAFSARICYFKDSHSPKPTNKGTTTMTKLLSIKATQFEEAFKAISLSTWNRPRTNEELRSFLSRREAATQSVEL